MRINLIPPDAREHVRLVQPEPVFAALGAFLIVFLLALSLVAQQQLESAREHLEAQRRAVAAIRQRQGETRELEERTGALEAALAGLESRLPAGDKESLADLLEYIGESAREQERVWLEEISLTDGRLRVRGFGSDAEVVARFLHSLGLAPSLATVTEGRVGAWSGQEVGLVEFQGEFRVAGGQTR